MTNGIIILTNLRRTLKGTGGLPKHAPFVHVEMVPSDVNIMYFSSMRIQLPSVQPRDICTAVLIAHP